MNSDNDKIFKSLATAYVEIDGAKLKSEMEEIDKSDFKFPDWLDERITWNIKREKKTKLIFRYVPIAACIIGIIVIFSSRIGSFTRMNLSALVADTTPSQKYNLEFVSARLPNNYSVLNVDYDNGKAVYLIESDTDNEIIILVEASKIPIDSKGLRAVNINGTKVYGISKSDYSLLTYEKDGTTYTLTSKYNYLDLIEISKSFI